MNKEAPGTLPELNAEAVIATPAVTTGVAVVAIGAVTVTTFNMLTALKPTIPHVPEIA